MNAIAYNRFGPPGVLYVEQRPTPEPADKEIRIRVGAASVSSTDAAFRSGNPFIARLAAGATKPRLRVLGDALAGTVEAIGKDVTRFKLGDRVFGASGPDLGAHAEAIVLPEDAGIATMPDAMSFAEGAGIADGGLTALPFIRDAGRVAAGTDVLIIGGAGAIGTIAIQLAKHYGARVTATAGGANAGLLASLGADEAIDYRREDYSQRKNAFDVIFDTVGKSSFREARPSLKRRGRYLTTTPSPRALASMVRAKLIGGGRRAVFAATGLRKPADKARDIAFMAKLFTEGELRIVIDSSYPLERFADAHARVDTGHKTGVVILEMNGDEETIDKAA